VWAKKSVRRHVPRPNSTRVRVGRGEEDGSDKQVPLDDVREIEVGEWVHSGPGKRDGLELGHAERKRKKRKGRKRPSRE